MAQEKSSGMTTGWKQSKLEVSTRKILLINSHCTGKLHTSGQFKWFFNGRCKYLDRRAADI